MVCVQTFSRASPAAAWPLLAEPRRWSSWAPHLRGAVGLGSPEVQLGRRGVVLVGLGAPVPVRITAKSPGRSWEWQAGPVRFVHGVQAHERGCLLTLELHAPPLIEGALGAVYGPVMRHVGQRLATVAARSA